jgi:type IV secretion system protein VirD4
LCGGLLNKIDEIQKMVAFLLPENGFYENEARILISVLILYVGLDSSKKNTFGEIYRILCGVSLENYLESVLNRFGDKLGYFAQLHISSFLGKTRENKELVRNLASSALELWADPEIDRTTSTSDFNITNFAKEKSTLYVTIESFDIERLRPLLQIFYQQCTSLWTAVSKPDGNKATSANGLLMLLDEFTSLGKMKFLENAIFSSRGNKLKFCLYLHDLDELEDIYDYGGTHSILSGCITKAACCTNNLSTAVLFSNLAGGRVTKCDGDRMVLPLLMPEELTILPREKIIVITDSMALECDKILYYEEPGFKDKIFEPAYIPVLKR